MKRIKLVVLVLCMFLSANEMNAQIINAVNHEDKFSVKFTGVQDNYLCFQVEIKNPDNNSILKISDKSEGELYTQNWKLKTPFQVFKIEKKDGQQLIFNLKTGTQDISKTFSATTRMIENTVVQENGLVIL